MTISSSEVFGGLGTASLIPKNPTYSSGSSSAIGVAINLTGVGVISLKSSGGSPSISVSIDGKTISGSYALLNLQGVLGLSDGRSSPASQRLPIYFRSSLTVEIIATNSGTLSWELIS